MTRKRGVACRLEPPLLRFFGARAKRFFGTFFKGGFLMSYSSRRPLRQLYAIINAYWCAGGFGVRWPIAATPQDAARR